MNGTQGSAPYNRYRSELDKLIDGRNAEDRSAAETWKLVSHWYKMKVVEIYMWKRLKM